ncbi:MAG: diguanylate cyclase [Cellvibrionaceae bacterium]|nr:diguanylate cyclase [Cellvibrionaceae bacterium]
MHNSVPLDPNERKAQSLGRYLILLLLGLQLVTVLLIIFISQFSIKRDIDEQASVILHHAVNESKALTQGFLEPAYRSVLMTRQLLENGSLSIETQPLLEDYFLGLLQNNPEMTGAYIATLDNDFYFVARNTDKPKAAFLSKFISKDHPGKASFVWRDAALAMIDRATEADDFQFKQRPWYQRAITEEALIWTEPYIFFTSKKLGITVATPFYNAAGDIIGAIGFDIALTQLSEFFADLKIYGAISAFMVSSEGMLIAAPSLRSEQLKLKSLDMSALADDQLSLERVALNHLVENSTGLKNKRLSSRFSYQQDAYNIRYEAFPIHNGPEWIIGAYAPRYSFLEKIEAGEKRNIWIGLGILLLSVIIGWYLIRKTWKPVNHFLTHVVVDQLTGLFNRRFLETAGSQMYLRMLRDEQSIISIAILDLDFFKKINAEFGNTVGNRVLMHFADFLRNTLGQDEVITRYSGDAFVIVLPGLDKDAAIAKIDAMRLKLDAWPLNVDELLVKLTFSAGLATIDQHNRLPDATFSDYIDRAKTALKKAKQKGRDCVVSANG